MSNLVKSLRSFLGRHYNDFLLAGWYILNIVLFVLFVISKENIYYFIALALLEGGVYHLLKKYNRKFLTIFYLSAILISLVIVFLIVGKGRI